MMKSLKIGDLLARTPIVQGGMGVGISLSGLASAVANEGGVGVISSAGLGVIYRDYSPDYNIASIWGVARRVAQGPRKDARHHRRQRHGRHVQLRRHGENRHSGEGRHHLLGCRAAVEPAVVPHRGLPHKTGADRLVARAAKLLCEKWLANYGYIPDAIVVEGPKAGGHLGYKADQIEDEHYSLEEILPPIVEEVHAFEAAHDCHIPVIAGGGVYTGEDIYNILQLGAEGVQMGTRFVATEECDADPAFKESYVHARKEDIEIIQSPVGMPGRAIHSSFLEKVKAGLKRPKSCPFNCIKTCDVSRSPYCIMLALYNAFRGRLENGYAFCGANAWRTEKIQSVRELIASLRKEYESFSLRDRLFPNKG